MNKIREEINKIFDYTALESELNNVMEIIETYLEKSFDAAKKQKHFSCGDYEDMYYNWKTWYDKEVNIS